MVSTDSDTSAGTVCESFTETTLNILKNTFELLFSAHSWLLSPLFLCAGFSMSLYSGIFPTAIGNTKSFNDAASFLGLVGILVGVGHIIAGLSFMLVSTWMSKANKTLLLLFFFTIQLFGVVLILINIPNDANQNETHAAPLVLSSPNKPVALVTAVLLGFSDAGINNVIYTSIPLIWKDNTLPAFSLFKLFQNSAGAISFAIAAEINLFQYLGLLIGIGSIALVCFLFLQIRQSQC